MVINPENKNIVSEITIKLNDLVKILSEYQNLNKEDDNYGTFICRSDWGYYCDCHSSS